MIHDELLLPPLLLGLLPPFCYLPIPDPPPRPLPRLMLSFQPLVLFLFLPLHFKPLLNPLEFLGAEHPWLRQYILPKRGRVSPSLRLLVRSAHNTNSLQVKLLVSAEFGDCAFSLDHGADVEVLTVYHHLENTYLRHDVQISHCGIRWTIYCAANVGVKTRDFHLNGGTAAIVDSKDSVFRGDVVDGDNDAYKTNEADRMVEVEVDILAYSCLLLDIM